jgi:hypothetical protein
LAQILQRCKIVGYRDFSLFLLLCDCHAARTIHTRSFHVASSRQTTPSAACNILTSISTKPLDRSCFGKVPAPALWDANTLFVGRVFSKLAHLWKLAQEAGRSKKVARSTMFDFKGGKRTTGWASDSWPLEAMIGSPL